MPPTTENPTDRAREDGGDEDWARWEQTFRDARPVLPELAMVRIEASMSREIDKIPASPPGSRLRARILWLVFALMAVNAITVWILMYSPVATSRRDTPLPGGRGASNSGTAITAPPALIQDRYPLDVPIGPQVVAPDLPIIPLAESWESIHDGAALPQSLSAKIVAPSAAQQDLLKAAEFLCGQQPDGWHALGLMEMRRAAGISAPVPSAFPPRLEEFDEVACWRLLPLNGDRVQAFESHLDRLVGGSFRSRTPAATWASIFGIVTNRPVATQRRIPVEYNRREFEFPSAIANRARFDLLVELGVTQTEAGLNVLTTRSYDPLKSLLTINDCRVMIQEHPGVSDYRAEPIRSLYPYAAHDLVECLVLSPVIMTNESSLIGRARKLPYLTDPQNLAVLLARLGPQDAWNKLVEPLMENEVAFIQHPPNFDGATRRSLPAATVEAKAKSMQEGVTNYTGAVTLAAGPWRIRCDKLSVYRNIRHGNLLTGSGNIHVRGVIGLFDATADEVTLNTETGDLKLSGRVHLDGWAESRDTDTCTILRTGEVRP